MTNLHQMKALIVISNETDFDNEVFLVNELFNEGLEYFHLRKPKYSEADTHRFLSGIEEKHLVKIAIHQHHQTAFQYNLKRLHFNTHLRKTLTIDKLTTLKEKGTWLSTSVHNTFELEELEQPWDHVFFGPVYDSISKTGYKTTFKKDTVLPVNKNVQKVIALGGINLSNIQEIINSGFNGAGILGALWTNPKEAMNTFKKLQTLCN
jgi:thiamine-phosphate pyrophosphorylase